MGGKDAVGVIFGNVGTTVYRFAVSNPKVERADYVEVSMETGERVLGQVMEMTRETDLGYEDAISISEGEEAIHSDRVTASVSVIGYRDGKGILQMPRRPFRAGEKVYFADQELIREVLGLKENVRTGAYVGFLRSYSIKVYLDINTLVQKHACVLAKTGGGKSYMVGVLLEEMMKKEVPIVILDPHGEYSSLIFPNNSKRDGPLMERFGVIPKGYYHSVQLYSPDTKTNADCRKLLFNGVNIPLEDITQLLSLAPASVPLVKSAIEHASKNFGDYTLNDLATILKHVPVSGKKISSTQLTLAAEVEKLVSMGIFSDKSSSSTRLRDLVQHGRTTIINLRGVGPEVSEVVASRIVERIFEARKRDRIPPLMLVVEEAHNFCPQAGSTKVSSILRTVAAEGRKFGMGLLVVTQRPAKVDKNVLSQCNTQIILKVTNPLDLKAISSSIEGMTPGLEEEIQRLPIGYALITGGGLVFPIIVETRVRETKHGGEAVDIVKENIDKEKGDVEFRVV